ncbi:ATP-binding cassette domain-containing protein, partial [Rhizobium sp. Pop5]
MDIRFEGAGVSFGARVALEPLTLALGEKRIGVIGLNGSGKTTFARLINGLTKPSIGRVIVNGRDMSDEKTAAPDVGFIFQSPQNQIILPIVRDDIAF